jgi:hypothetical protein
MLLAIWSLRFAISASNGPEQMKGKKHMANKTHIDLAADAVASVLKTIPQPQRKWASDEHKRALAFLKASGEPTDIILDAGERLANVSAVRQELEKGGVLPIKETTSAFILLVKTALG